MNQMFKTSFRKIGVSHSKEFHWFHDDLKKLFLKKFIIAMLFDVAVPFVAIIYFSYKTKEIFNILIIFFCLKKYFHIPKLL